MKRDIITEAGAVIEVKTYKNLVLLAVDGEAFALTARDARLVAMALLGAASDDVMSRCRRCIRALIAIVEGGAAGSSLRDVLSGARELLGELEVDHA